MFVGDRRSISFLILVAIAVTACGISPSPATPLRASVSPTVAPTPVASLGLSPKRNSPSPSAYPSPSQSDGVASRIRSVTPSGEFFPMGLSNSGPQVVFNSRDADHMGDVWLADLQNGTMTRIYRAPAGNEVYWLRLDGGRLVWLEYRHSTAGPVAEWWIRARDMATGRESVLAHDVVALDRPFPYIVRVLGDRLAEGIRGQDGGVRIEVRSINSEDPLIETPVKGVLYDMALAGDDMLLWSAGTDVPEYQTVKDLHLYRKTPHSSAIEIGAGAFRIRADQQAAAWETDKTASEQATGHPADPQLTVAPAPFLKGRPAPTPVDRVAALDGFDTADGWLAWCVETASAAGRGAALLLSGPGWGSAQQLPLSVDTPWVSLGGGWLAWYVEGGDDVPDAIYGLELSTVGQ
jgi:hypothetical protein